MKLAAIALSVVMTIPAVWAQRTPKQPLKLNPDVSAQPSPRSRAAKSRARTARPEAVTTPAPLVVQIFVDPSTASLTAFAIATATIPATAQIAGNITLLDDNSSISFLGAAVSDLTGGSDMGPGDFIQLPEISRFGSLFGGELDYIVQVVPARGATLQTEGVAIVGEQFFYSDLASNTPFISSATQSINGAKDVILQLPGFYTGNPVQVVLSDLFANYVVPASAITVSATEVDVDLSKVVNFDLDSTGSVSMKGTDPLFVTVSDQNIADTVAFRFVPPPPGTFNPAPVQ